MTGENIIKYIRENQSATALRLALCEVAHLVILPQDSVLQAAHEDGKKTVYTFNNFNCVVRYTHDALTVGETYPAGTIIGGEYIKVYSATSGNAEQWWRKLDWSDGLVLTGPFAGLTIPDRIVRFYWVSDWTDTTGTTRKHIRADFDDSDTALLDRFWQQIHDSEERTERTLTDVSELSTVDEGVDVNLNILDFYFRQIYKDRGVVIDLRTAELGDRIDRAVNSFLRRELPVGSIPIKRTNGSEAFA